MRTRFVLGSFLLLSWGTLFLWLDDVGFGLFVISLLLLRRRRRLSGVTGWI